MEFVSTRRNRKWRKKRRWRKRLRDQSKVEVEVRFSKHEKFVPRHIDSFARGTLATNTMQADAFWKNYTAAQEWQTRHNVTWWKSRCGALEYENEVLRNKIRSLASNSHCPDTVTTETNCQKLNVEENVYSEDAEEFEFTVTEEMLNFFEKSERHRRKMKQKYKSINDTHEDKGTEDSLIIGGAENARARKEEANELYGEESSKILAMETALQATVDNYKDKVWTKRNLKVDVSRRPDYDDNHDVWSGATWWDELDTAQLHSRKEKKKERERERERERICEVRDVGSRRERERVPRTDAPSVRRDETWSSPCTMQDDRAGFATGRADRPVIGRGSNARNVPYLAVEISR